MAEDMEQRLVALINNSTERVLDRISAVESRFGTRFTTVEARFEDLDTKLAITRELVARLPGLLADAFEKAVLPRLTAIEERLAALERKP